MMLHFVGKGQLDKNIFKGSKYEADYFSVHTEEQKQLFYKVCKLVDDKYDAKVGEHATAVGSWCDLDIVLKTKVISRRKEILQMLQAEFEFDKIEWVSGK